MRRTVLTALVALVVVSAGCTGLITGEEVAFEANTATVQDDTLESTGYEETNVTEQTITRDVSVGGEERTVSITNQYAVYARSGSVGGVEVSGVAQFALISTPGAEMAGQTLNPVATLSHRQLVERFSGRTGTVDDIEFVENRTAESLGDERAVGEFNGTTERVGQELTVRIHVASFEHEGDVLVAIAVHPVGVDEEATVDDLLAGIEHSGSEE